jgi:iron complex transport system ATP-binding protein
VIEVKNLSLDAHQGVKILESVSMQMNDGLVHIVIGPNGSGKTTLLKTVAGLLKPTSGAVYIDNVDTATLRPLEAAARVSYLASEHSTPFSYTVEDTILWGRWHQHKGYPSDQDRQAAKLATERLGIEHLTARSVTTLSLGEQKKTHLAKSLSSGVKHYIWDEPLGPLDVRASLELLEQAKAIAAQGHVVVMSLHDLSLALRYADSLSILANGKVAWHGLPGDSDCLTAIQTVFGVRVDRGGTELNISLV